MMPRLLLIGLPLLTLLVSQSASAGQDISTVPLWDGEVQDQSGLTLNRFGGNPIAGINATVSHTTSLVRSGTGAFRIDTNGVIAANNAFDFVAMSLTGFGPSANYIDTRDLTPFEQVRFWLNNQTGSSFRFVFEIKDNRDSNSHRARRSYSIGGAAGWNEIVAPLDLNDGWQVTGSPDLTRAKLFALVIETTGQSVNGSIGLDDMILVEKGGTLDAQTAPIEALVTRLARRQFDGLWGSRDRDTGLLPSISSFADISATNVLAGLIQLLPGAIDRGWVTKTDADSYLDLVAMTLTTLMTPPQFHFLPPRYVDRVSLAPVFVREESSVDAAFLFLALHGYKSQASTPQALQMSIESVLDKLVRRRNVCKLKKAES